jgi:DNA-directed RNA polymerase specialized sigma24 family protein
LGETYSYADGLLKAIKAFFYQYRHIYNHPDSEDVLNATFAKVVISFDKYSPELPLLPSIKRIAHNEVVKVLRSLGERSPVRLPAIEEESKKG